MNIFHASLIESMTAFHVFLRPSHICFNPSAVISISPEKTPLKNLPNPSIVSFNPLISSSPCPVKETSAISAAAIPAINKGIQLPVNRPIPSPAASSPAMMVNVFSRVNPFSMTSFIPTTSIARPPITSAMPAAVDPNAMARPPARAAAPASIPRKFCISMPLFHASSQK